MRDPNAHQTRRAAARMHVLTATEQEKRKREHWAYGKFMIYDPRTGRSQAKRRRLARGKHR